MFDGVPQKQRTKVMKVADLFCGAGGSSTGAQRALKRLGFEMDLLCVNHWPVAIETHTLNHPNARHYCQDVSTVRPHMVVPEGKLDLLMASPTCTYHSRARGGKPISDQQRMDPWHVITWLTEVRVRCVIIENVPEFVKWGPVDARTGKPVKSREGEYFVRWVETIEGLGFKVDWKILNAANYGDATTRERFFLIARSDRKQLRWPDATHAKAATGADLLGGGRRRWRAAREIIDWSIKGRSIFDRKKPLSPKTLARIYAGAQKFGWPEPFLVILRQHMDGQSVDGPLPTVTAGGTHIGLAQPIICANRENNVARATDEPLPGMTTSTGGGMFVAEPFLLNRHGENGSTRAHDVEQPVPTADCRGAGYVVEPFVLSQQSSGAPRSTELPLPTITTGGAGSPGHVGCARHAIVEPFILSQHAGGAPRDTAEPVPGMTCGGAHALIAPYYGSGSGETCSGVSTPLPTVTTKARFSLVVPVTNSNGGPGPRSTDDPLPTMTAAKGGEFAIAVPVTHGKGGNRARDVNEEPLPTVTGAHRGELGFIVAAFGERPGQTPRVHSVDEPSPTICADGRIQLAVAETRGFDILFRMLEPKELAAAMGFTDEESAYEFTGTKTDVTKQIGNAVPVNTAAALVGALMAE